MCRPIMKCICDTFLLTNNTFYNKQSYSIHATLNEISAYAPVGFTKLLAVHLKLHSKLVQAVSGNCNRQVFTWTPPSAKVASTVQLTAGLASDVHSINCGGDVSVRLN